MEKLSVVLATRNEQKNIERCLASVKGIADEVIVVDEYSTDKTREIAERLGAKVFLEPHYDIFHVTKEKALRRAQGDWVLQLDADEEVTPELSKQIKQVLTGDYVYRKNRLFERHRELVEARDGKIGKKVGEIAGYFIPRRNIFLGRSLIHAGVYPDGVIRLVKNGKARFPQKSVHEQIELDGEVSWLSGDLLHYDSPTFKRYLARANRYTDLKAAEFARGKISKSPFAFVYFSLFKPFFVFINLYFRHLGFLDGPRGFLWSVFSALHFPVSYFKYLTGRE